jgi:hypothetical protein
MRLTKIPSKRCAEHLLYGGSISTQRVCKNLIVPDLPVLALTSMQVCMRIYWGLIVNSKSLSEKLLVKLLI